MSKKLKILFVSSSSGSRGGGELFLCYLAAALKRAGHTVQLWMSDHPRMDELEALFAPVGRVTRSPYTNTYDRRLRSLGHFSSLLRPPPHLLAEWEALGPDVIHLNKQNLEDGLDLLCAANAWAGPQLCTVHITQPASYLRARHAAARDWIARQALRRYRGKLVSFSNRVDELRAFVGARPPVVAIDNGVVLPDPATLAARRAAARAELGLSEDDFLFLGVGRIEAQKRPLEFVRLVHELHARVPNPKIWWVGAGRLENEWDAAVAALPFKCPVERLGWKTEVAPYLAAADLFIHPAAYEGLPFGLLEAMAWRLPCLIRDDLAAELPTAVRDACLIATATSTAAIALEPGPLAEVGAKGRAKVEQHYSIERMAEAYVRHYGSA